MAAAPAFHPAAMQLAFVFLLVGYGTKAGLAPMHTWLPDAHAEAPSALSAMMSGVLLAVALYAIVRWKAVVNARGGPGRSPTACSSGSGSSRSPSRRSAPGGQRHYKRMLAYSSIEHIGLMCVGLALGPLGVFAAMLHLLNHTAGQVDDVPPLRTDPRTATAPPTSRRVSGLLRTMPLHRRAVRGRRPGAGRAAAVRHLPLEVRACCGPASRPGTPGSWPRCWGCSRSRSWPS